MDLISREAALAILYECGGDEITPPNMIEMRGRMYKLPAVDAVEVVRCCDCRQWQRHTQINRDYGGCRRYGSTMFFGDFCSYGELQTNCGADMRGNPHDF